jgi:ABC-type lipoprotein export system ATPase subunit
MDRLFLGHSIQPLKALYSIIGATSHTRSASIEISGPLAAYYYRRLQTHCAVTTTLTPLIHAQNVSRHYTLGDSTIPAVNDISLDIRPGEFVALLGSSGSGKSTFLNLLAGLDRPTSGAIHVRGRNLAAIDPPELARYRRDTVGMVFQSFNLLPRMTLAENVELPLRLAEVDRTERASRVQSALEHVRLGARSRHRPPELSGGEQQRGAIARALVNRPTILFADEPTGNLDSVNGEQILMLLREIQSSLGMTIIMVTHERPLAERFASRIVTLGDGKLKSDLPNASAAVLQSAIDEVQE